jgi:glucosamine-6-phosphate deaminase
VLGLPAGRTPKGIYDELVRRYREQGLEFTNVITFNVDEYCGLGPEDPGSFRRWMGEHLLGHVDVHPANAHSLDGRAPPEDTAEHCAAYEEQIAGAGGLSLLVLGIGRDGHIAFNEPGSAEDSRTRRVTLTRETRRWNIREFSGEGAVPEQALTMGVGTLLEAKRIRLHAYGPGKAEVIAQMLRGPRGPELPASFLRGHGDVRVYLDRQAAAGLGLEAEDADDAMPPESKGA